MVETGTNTKTSPKITRFQKFGLGMQVFMLRRGWMGSASDYIMVITVKGRKSGRQYSTPIAYQRDGQNIIAINQGWSNWFRNVKANGEATLEIKKEKIKVQAMVVNDEQERNRIFSLYKKDPNTFERLFRIPVSAPEAELQKVMSKWQFVKFTRK
jgi:deazaflavin-dependent oxidoreductase (nitroreductase family)